MSNSKEHGGQNLSRAQKKAWDQNGPTILTAFCKSARWTNEVFALEVGISETYAQKFRRGNHKLDGSNISQPRYPNVTCIDRMASKLDSFAKKRDNEYLKSAADKLINLAREIHRLGFDPAPLPTDPVRQDALAEIEAAKLELATVLKPSPQLIHEFISHLNLKLETGDEETEVEELSLTIANELVTMDPNPPVCADGPYRFGWTPYRALREIQSLRLTLDKFGRAGSTEREILSRMFEILAKLIFGTDEIERLKLSLESGASVIVIFPATNLILAEIIMARLDQRRLGLQQVSQQELNTGRDDQGGRWGDLLRSKFQIVKPAIVSPSSFLNELENHFDIEASRIILGLPAGSPSDIDGALEFLNYGPEPKGTPFFICNYLINPAEKDIFEQKIAQIKKKWSWKDEKGKIRGIRFINLLSRSEKVNGSGEDKEEDVEFDRRRLWELAIMRGTTVMLPIDREIL